ncbi:MAG: aminotransferase class I/II-fold pyridoxal phosphate-dependent enzyme [Flavobacteriaceae bacterium TMED42]|nr:MAG: aminotransferase class I/II-fold pyridoxal phosphate-dependent enzyme [Flavobacteriaceae bacterium TMED42]RPG67878.1 MAG: aminotransferase class I/II-fold pyridoxal phosphate-dependent enzyme [Flavobacteriaceae bacterium TMED42]
MKKHFETEAIRTQMERSQYAEHSSPLYLTSSFVFDNAEELRASFADELDRNIYSRFSNPNTQELVDKICRLEVAEDGLAFASGMAAVYTSFAALLNSGDHIVSVRSIFGSTHTLFKKYFTKRNIETTYFNANTPQQIEEVIQPNTKIIYIETPTNPGLDILDMSYLSDIAKKHQIILAVDNCFATPYLQKPVDFGADLIIHSATKLIDGQGRVLGGLIVGREDLITEIRSFFRNSGSTLSPFNAWVLSKSLETLAVRLDRHCENALELAKHLQNHPKISQVRYPFLPSHPHYEIAKKQMLKGGNIITIELKGGIISGQTFLNQIKMCSLSANLGDTRTIVTHPATSTHSKLSPEERALVSITDGLIRLSIGLENIEDIKQDIDQALEKV